jgi:hypothetical protein
MARPAARVRSETPSLAMMWRTTWLLTVPGLTTSSRAIWGLVWPCGSSRRISVSPSVSGSETVSLRAPRRRGRKTEHLGGSLVPQHYPPGRAISDDDRVLHALEELANPQILGPHDLGSPPRDPASSKLIGPPSPSQIPPKILRITPLYAVCRYLQKVSKFFVPKTLQSVTSDVSSCQSVGAKLNRHN